MILATSRSKSRVNVSHADRGILDGVAGVAHAVFPRTRRVPVKGGPQAILASLPRPQPAVPLRSGKIAGHSAGETKSHQARRESAHNRLTSSLSSCFQH
jgi:hypothetical protein